MLAYEHELGSETLSLFVDSSVDNVLLQTYPDFTSDCDVLFNASCNLFVN